MKKYKRIILTGHGGPEVLKVVEEELLEPDEGFVRVRMLAAGVGFSDIMAQHGGYPLSPRIPFTPGYDFAGIVEGIGKGVEGIEDGQYVAALKPDLGCYSEYISVAPKYTVPVPEGLDAAEVVGLVLNYLTAHCILHKKAQLRGGETVLIHAAAGGVGTALLQLGKLMNLKMYGTASASKHETVRELRGIPIDYKKEDFVQRILKDDPDGIDAAFDPIGGENLSRSYRIVKKGGRVISYGFAGDEFGGLMPMVRGVLKVFFLNLIPDGKRVKICATPGEVKKDNGWYRATLKELLDLLAAGKIQPIVGARIPLEEVGRAHQLVEEGKTAGKVVLIGAAKLA